jgi:kynurenine formamidase
MTKVETRDTSEMELTSEAGLPRRLLLQRLAAGASLAVAAGSPVLAQDGTAPAPPNGAAAQRPEPEPDETTAKFIGLMKQLSNWNRWGPDDQMGTVNLITPAKRKAALALVREGVTFSMERDLDLKKSADNTQPVVLDVIRPGKGQPPNKFKQGGTADTLFLAYHNFVQTHMNALAHFMYDQKMYNGRSQDMVTKEDGAIVNNIMAFKNGVVTRGVLYDIPRHRGVDWLEPGELVYPDELEAWEKKSGAKVGKGDVIMVRTGRSLRREKLGPWQLSLGIAGLHMDCAEWLHERDVAIAGSDGDLDARPSKVTGIGAPLHTLCLAAMGTPLFDEMDLELVGQEAAKRKRWEYAVFAAPMAVPGGTGSVINPIAMF